MSDELNVVLKQFQEALEKIASDNRIAQATTTKTMLWCKSDCANYLGVSLSSMDKMIAANQFIPHRLRIGAGPQGNRWIPQDVIDWAMSKQFETGRPRAA